MNSAIYKVIHPLGLHARACTLLASALQEHFWKEDIIFINPKNDQEGSAKSVMDLLLLGANFGSKVEVVTPMNDEKFKVLKEFIDALFVGLMQDGKYNHCHAYDLPNFVLSEAKSRFLNPEETTQLLVEAASKNKVLNFLDHQLVKSTFDLNNYDVQVDTEDPNEVLVLLAKIEEVIAESNCTEEQRKNFKDVALRISEKSNRTKSSQGNSSGTSTLKDDIEEVAKLTSNIDKISKSVTPYIIGLLKWFGFTP